MDLSIFSPYLLFGKDWLDHPKVMRYVQNILLTSPEVNLKSSTPLFQRNSTYYRHATPGAVQVFLPHNLTVILLNETQVTKDLQQMFPGYKFSETDLHNIFRSAGLIGYVTGDKVVLLNT